MPGLEPTRNSALKIAVVCFPTEPRHLASFSFPIGLFAQMAEVIITFTNKNYGGDS